MNNSPSGLTDDLFSLALNSNTASSFGTATAGDAPFSVQQHIDRVSGLLEMMNMVVTLQKMNNNSLPWLPKSKLAEPIYAQVNNARWLSARRKLGSRLTNEETGQSRQFTFAFPCSSPLVHASGSSSTLSQSSSRASTTRHPAPAAPLPDPAFSRSTLSDARTSRSSPVHGDDSNGGRLFTPAARSARGRLSGAQLGLKKSASHAPSPFPAEAMQVMPISKEKSRKGKGVQRFARGKCESAMTAQAVVKAEGSVVLTCSSGGKALIDGPRRPDQEVA
ncbi:BQ5605_C006g04103 [Microbotryum silenes-dioicae]|uniref:BQ5605_C006g04103 protein n=1 Tax=Microbotryum silenes-dioicae TaxID=796604 RepID=A0A2X0MA48_9BASI|nr:BQ5605_C006g04103 [Microbotryum silenes-dioicae]